MGEYYDEVYEDSGEPRPHYRAAMEALGAVDLAALRERLRARTLEREVRYGSTGPDEFVIDAVPRMFSPQEWDQLDRGLAQRVRALDAFLRDAYGERRIVAAGVVPGRLIEDGAFYEPDMQGVEVPVWVGFAGLDVVRGADGEFNVLEDNVRMPTGIGFAPLAWEAVEDLLDGALPARAPGAPGEPMERFLAILRAAAPAGREDPSIVVLGDGFENDAQWEISDVAFRLGVPMVTLDDIRQREGRVYAHVDGRRREVDVIYRRSNYHLLRDEDGSPSALSEKLLEPMRRGTVTVVNPPGVGIADDKLAHAYVEEMIRFYLSEEPVIAPARSYDLTDDGAREDALGRLGELVVKVRDRVGGEGVLIGKEAESAREDIEARPQDFIAQELVELSRHPTLLDGRLAKRRIDLRPLIASSNGEDATVLGGLTRVALGEDSKVVNMAQGGGVKATWGGPGMSAAKTVVTAARAAANNKAVRAVAATAAAKAATRAEPMLRERYDRWSARRVDRDRAIKLARQIRGRWSEDTIIGGEPHHVVWKDGVPVEAFPAVEDLEVRPELRDFDERLAKTPPTEREPRRLGRRSQPR